MRLRMLIEWVSHPKSVGTTGSEPGWGRVISSEVCASLCYVSPDFLSCPLSWQRPWFHISWGHTEAQRGQHPCPKL